MNSCVFCQHDSLDTVYKDEHVRIILNKYPKFIKHYLIIPNQHFNDIIDLHNRNIELYNYMHCNLCKFASILNLEHFSIASNCGALSGQSVFHYHIHMPQGEYLENK